MDTTVIIISLCVFFLIYYLLHDVTVTKTTTVNTNTTRVVPVPVPVPVYHTPKTIIGGCAGTMYGCCSNGVTAKANHAGTNCGV